MDAADWLLDALAAEGVTRLFGNPGSTELPLLDALSRRDDVRYVLGLHEAAVMGMADGYAQAGGGLGVVNVHVQPGIANAVSGVLNAARARVPMLVTVGQQVTGLRHRAPFLGGDVLGPVRGLARWCGEVDRAADLPDAVRAAVRAARTPPCGPAVLSLPMDVLTDAAPTTAHRAGAHPASTPHAEALCRAVDLLDGARNPVILAGDGVAHEDAAPHLSRLAQRLGAPVWGEPMAGRVALPWGHRLWAGQLPPFAAQIRPLLAGHDVILAVGMPVFRLFGDSPGPALPDGARLVHVDVDPAEVGRTETPEVGVVGSVAATLAVMADGVHAVDGRADAVAARIAEARGRASVTPAGDPAGTPGPADFARAVAGAVAPDDLLVDESLTSGRALRVLLGDRRPGTWLAHRGSALGWGLPAAVGAAIALPGRRVMCLQGDGSLLFGVHALWTAAAQGVAPALVVADNGGYEILRAGMEGLTGRPDDAWPGLALSGPRLDLAAVCAGFGADVAQARTTAELPDAMHDLWARAVHRPAVLVVDVAGRTPPVGYPIAKGGG